MGWGGGSFLCVWGVCAKQSCVLSLVFAHSHPPQLLQYLNNKNSHLGGGGNAVDVDYGSMHFEVSQLDVSLDIT